MYIYCALINALSAHIIHINLNMIFYTHVESQFYQKQFTWKYYTETHTHMGWAWDGISIRIKNYNTISYLSFYFF